MTKMQNLQTRLFCSWGDEVVHAVMVISDYGHVHRQRTVDTGSFSRQYNEKSGRQGQGAGGGIRVDIPSLPQGILRFFLNSGVN